MAMTKIRLHNTEDDISFEPKLTRAKAKYSLIKYIIHLYNNSAIIVQ